MSNSSMSIKEEAVNFSAQLLTVYDCYFINSGLNKLLMPNITISTSGVLYSENMPNCRARHSGRLGVKTNFESRRIGIKLAFIEKRVFAEDFLTNFKTSAITRKV